MICSPSAWPIHKSLTGVFDNLEIVMKDKHGSDNVAFAIGLVWFAIIIFNLLWEATSWMR